MNEPMFRHIPMILETPGGVGYDKEIQLLHSLCKNQELTHDDRQWKSWWWWVNKQQQKLQIMAFMLFVDTWWQTVEILMMMSQQTATKIANHGLHVICWHMMTDSGNLDDDESTNSNKNCKSWPSCYLLTHDDRQWKSWWWWVNKQQQKLLDLHVICWHMMTWSWWWWVNKQQQKLQNMLFVDTWWQTVEILMMKSTNSNKNCKSWPSCYLLTHDDRQWKSWWWWVNKRQNKNCKSWPSCYLLKILTNGFLMTSHRTAIKIANHGLHVIYWQMMRQWEFL